MKAFAALVALVVLAGLGLLAAEARGDGVPVPTLPTTTVSVPTLPVPTTVPSLPVPTTATTVVSTVSSVTTVASGSTTSPVSTSSVSTSPLGSSVTGGGSSSSSSGGPAGSSGSSGSSSGPSGTSGTSGTSGVSGTSGTSGSSGGSSGPGVERLDSSRSWIGTTGPKRHRTTVLTFYLPRGARVVFTVTQVSPLCRVAARFTLRGHRGANRVRLGGRANGKQLAAGTYKIVARTRSGRSVARVTLVVVAGTAPTKAELAAARRANVCRATRAFASVFGASAGVPSGNLAVAEVRRSLPPTSQLSAMGPATGATHSGILASSVEKAAHAVRPLLVAVLAAAILLLGLAALPQAAVADRRASDLLARHRIEIAGLGAAALVGAAVAFLLG